MDPLPKQEGAAEASGHLLPAQPGVKQGDTRKVHTISFLAPDPFSYI